VSTIIEDKAIVLFQGDSITDAGWNRQDPASLGGGYAMMAASWFNALHPEKKVVFLNRGISGDRARDLEARWQTDCLDLKPTWVSIMIGINDTWRRYDSNDPTSTEAYEKSYRAILTLTRNRLKANLILIEPFVLPVPEDRRQWRVDLDPRLHVVRALAREFGAVLVPLDGIFAEAAARREPAFWASDGVHPSLDGHALIAEQLIASLAPADVAWFRKLKADPKAVALLKLIRQRGRLLADAWLTDAGHLRPGMAKGLPVAEAEAKAAELEKTIRANAAVRSSTRVVESSSTLSSVASGRRRALPTDASSGATPALR
jgi:acyl-CoA thioesterase-1